MREQTILADIHMLATDKESNIVRNTYKFTPEHGGPLDVIKEPISNAQDRGYEYQHLYATTDEEIKEGDIILVNGAILYEYKPDYSKPSITSLRDLSIYNEGDLKIVATTNSELWESHKGECIRTILCGKIPTTFLQPYVDTYNAGKPIKQVGLEVDIETVIEEISEEGDYQDVTYTTLKLKPNGSVIIHPIKEKSYTREEVRNILKESEEFSSNYKGRTDVIQWFNNNYPI